ncbi:MAG: S8 family serine peptidase [Opitutales bacterium]
MCRCLNRFCQILPFSVAVILLVGLRPALATGSNAPQAIQPVYVQSGMAAFREALLAFHGEDLVGADGPMSKVERSLLVDYFISQGATRPTNLGGFYRWNTPFSLQPDRRWVECVAMHDTAALKVQLRALGVTEVKSRGHLISGLAPITAIDNIAMLAELRLMRPGLARGNAGVITSQGDPALGAPAARAEAPGFTGQGITIGTLSDSYDTAFFVPTFASDDIATGDLPPDPLIVEDFFGGFFNSTIDEGRAMMQIIFDVAPGANQQFATAFNTQVAFAENILALRDAGSDIIVDDIIFFAEPAFQDGVIAQAVDTVVADGALYFSSAGNNADRAYDASFVPSQANIVGLSGGPLFDFDPGPGDDPFQQISVTPGTEVTLVLQWDEPFVSVSGAPGCQVNLDLIITGTGDGERSALFSAQTNNLGGDAVEILQFTYNGVDVDGIPGTDTRLNMVVEQVGAAAPARLKLIYFDAGGTLDIDEYFTGSATLYGHANAAGAIAVGAAPYFGTPAFGVNPPLLESFSARGGTPILFDTAGNRLSEPELRPKPEITAPDGGNTTFFGEDIQSSQIPGFNLQDDDTFPNFFGTSAAAPHAAAVAALLLEKSGGPGSLTPAQVLETLQSTSIDINPPGFDAESGAGLIQADAALSATQFGFLTWQRLNFPEGDFDYDSLSESDGVDGGNPQAISQLDPFGPDDDADGDGVINLFEFYGGTDPNAPNSAPFSLRLDGDAVVLRLREDTQANLSFTRVRWREALTAETGNDVAAVFEPVGTEGVATIFEASIPLAELPGNAFFNLEIGL